jgi:hypothetical protein
MYIYMNEVCRRRWRVKEYFRNGRRETSLSPLYAGQARKDRIQGEELEECRLWPEDQDLADQLLFLAAVGGTLRLEA